MAIPGFLRSEFYRRSRWQQNCWKFLQDSDKNSKRILGTDDFGSCLWKHGDRFFETQFLVLLLRAVTVAPWCSSGLAIHLVELSLRLLVVLLRRRRRLILASLRRRRRMTAWFVALLQLLERDITIDMLDYTSLSSSMPKSLHCKSRQVSTRHRRPNDDYAALHICAKIERRAFPIRAIRRPLSAIKHYHNEVNFVIHSA